MESAGLFAFSILVLYQLAIIFILVCFVIAIINLSMRPPKKLLGFGLAAFILFLPANFLILHSGSWLLYVVLPIMLLLAILLRNNPVSAFLFYLNAIILLAYAFFFKGMLYVIPFVGGGIGFGPRFSFFEKMNDLEKLSFGSWFYLAVWVITLLSIIGGVLIFFKQISWGSTAKKVLAIIPILLIISLVRDYVVYNSKVISTTKNVPITEPVQKIPFIRDKAVFIVNSDGSGEEKVADFQDKIFDLKISFDDKYIAFETGGLDTKANVNKVDDIKIVDIETKNMVSVEPSISDSAEHYSISWSDNDLLAFGMYTKDPQIVKQYGTNTYGESVFAWFVYDVFGKELNKFYGYSYRSTWVGSDLALLEQDGSVSVSAGGVGSVKEIGSSPISLIQGSNRAYAKEGTHDLIFQSNGGEYKNGKGITYKLYSINIQTGKGAYIQTDVSHPALFSPDMKYYSNRGVDQSNYYIRATDGSTSILLPIGEYGHQAYIWLHGSQRIAFESPDGIKVIDVNGQITQLTSNPTDQLNHISD